MNATHDVESFQSRLSPPPNIPYTGKADFVKPKEQGLTKAHKERGEGQHSRLGLNEGACIVFMAMICD